MKFTAFTTICFYYFSLLIPIQSELIYVYNYDNFDDIFHEGNRNDFNVYKYEDIDNIFETKYDGPNIGGAFQMQGNSTTITHQFDGYLVDVTASFYCYNAEEVEMNWEMSILYEDGTFERNRVCIGSGPSNWKYNITWIPYFPLKQVSFHSMPSNVRIQSMSSSIEGPPETPRASLHIGIERCKEGLQLGSNYAEGYEPLR